MDLVIAEVDGWFEITDLLQDMEPKLQKEIWDYKMDGAKAPAFRHGDEAPPQLS